MRRAGEEANGEENELKSESGRSETLELEEGCLISSTEFRALAPTQMFEKETRETHESDTFAVSQGVVLDGVCKESDLGAVNLSEKSEDIAATAKAAAADRGR